MSPRQIYLITSRQPPKQRSHFAIFIPSLTTPQTGSLINVVGAPMVGFAHEFKRNYNPGVHSTEPYEMHPLGELDSSHVTDWPDSNGVCRTDTEPAGDIEIVASRIPAPKISENFLAPVNDTTNRRCQEWTTDYIRTLIAKGYIGEEALEIVQSKRDPPTHGVGLQPVPRP